MNNGNYYNGNYNGDYNNNGCPPPPANNGDIFTPGPSGKSRGVAGLLAIFLGGFGIQSDYYTVSLWNSQYNMAYSRHIDAVHESARF